MGAQKNKVCFCKTIFKTVCLKQHIKLNEHIEFVSSVQFH